MHKRTLVTFLLALSAFVAVGAGVMLLVSPGSDAERSEQAERPAEATAAVQGNDTVGAPADGEFALVSEAQAIARPDHPSRLVIPTIALDTKIVDVGIVVENGRPVWDTAAFAVGYHRGTALPGTRGNTVMAGHISSPVSKKGEVFKRLPEVRIGDRVEVYVGERRVVYAVSEIRTVLPTAVQVMNQTPDATLTLITCYPDYDYSRRLVVVGSLVEG
jgi:sortase A